MGPKTGTSLMNNWAGSEQHKMNLKYYYLIGGNPRIREREREWTKEKTWRKVSKMRGRSYTPSPPPRYSRRGGGGGRSPSPRRRYAPRESDLPTSLLVRNLRHDCRQVSSPFSSNLPFFSPESTIEIVFHLSGLKIFADLSVNLVLSKTFISLKIITLGESLL